MDVRVTCDGIWSRQGHQAKYRVVVVASWGTGLVQILSKFGYECHAKRHMESKSDEFLNFVSDIPKNGYFNFVQKYLNEILTFYISF